MQNAECRMQNANSAPTHGRGKHVLCIDDDEAIVFLTTRLLRRLRQIGAVLNLKQ